MRPIKCSIASFDKKHAAGIWEVSGPVQVGVLGKPKSFKFAGWGVRAIEPRMFGGTNIYDHGLTWTKAQKIVGKHNAAVFRKRTK